MDFDSDFGAKFVTPTNKKRIITKQLNDINVCLAFRKIFAATLIHAFVLGKGNF